MTALPSTASSTAPPALPSGLHLPALITDAGEGAARRFVEFFTAHVRNPHTRRAYARALLAQPNPKTLGGLRDRAMIALMLYSFARVSAVLGLRLADYYSEGKRWHVRLREKRGQERVLPVHHEAEAAVDAWIAAAGLTEPGRPLFRRLGRDGAVHETAPSPQTVTTLIRRHARCAGIATPGLGSHALQATGITTFLANDGALDVAQEIAGHADVKTTRLYDRRGARATVSEIERVRFKRLRSLHRLAVIRKRSVAYHNRA